MTTIDDLRAQLEREDEIVNRCRPELDVLKNEIGVWIRAKSNGIPMAEPVEARQRYAELQAELWTARDHMVTRRLLGEAESRARALLANIALHNDVIAQLRAQPIRTEAQALRIGEDIARIERYRANDQRQLDLIGYPGLMLASDSMKAA